MRKRTVYPDDDPNLCAELQVIWLSCQKFHSLGLQFTCVAKACGPTYKGMKCIGISIYGTAADKDIFIEIEISLYRNRNIIDIEIIIHRTVAADRYNFFFL